MVGVPFIYFALLSLFIYSRNGKHIDVALLISIMFAFSALVGMYLVGNNLADVWCVFHGYETVEATVVYCGLITLCMIPFIRLSSSTLILRPVSNPELLKILAIASFVWLLVLFAFNIGDFYKSLTTDMGALIKQNVLARIDPVEKIPVLIRYPIIICNYLFRCFWIFVFLAFYSRFVQRLPSMFTLMLLIASLSGPFFGILGGDRSKIIYWILTVVFCFFFFKQQMNRKERRMSVILMGIFIATALLYIFTQTEARFSDDARLETGSYSASQNSILVYLGQPYINFCYFYEKFSSDYHFLGILFPFTTNIFIGDLVGGTLIQQYLTLDTGIFTGVFYTYIGHIMMAAGFKTAFIFCIVFTIAAILLLKKKKTYTLLDGYVYMAFASVLFLGLFVHYYTSPFYTPGLVLFYFFLRYISYGNRKRV